MKQKWLEENIRAFFEKEGCVERVVWSTNLGCWSKIRCGLPRNIRDFIVGLERIVETRPLCESPDVWELAFDGKPIARLVRSMEGELSFFSYGGFLGIQDEFFMGAAKALGRFERIESVWL